MFSKFFKKNKQNDVAQSSYNSNAITPTYDENVEVVECYDQDCQYESEDGQMYPSTVSNTNVLQQTPLGMTLGTMNKVMDVYNNSLIIKRDIKALECKRDVELAKIVAKFELGKDALTKVFGERQGALGKHYEVLDKALASNDRKLIIESLRGISYMVASRPLQDFNAFLEAWDDESKPFDLGF